MSVFIAITSKDKIKDKKTGRYIKTSQERYKDVETGKIISRRQYDKYRKSVPRAVRVTRRKQDIALAKSFQEKMAQKGKVMNLRSVRLSSGYTSIIKDLKKGAQLRDAGKKEEGDALIKKALEKTTRRDLIDPEITPGESG